MIANILKSKWFWIVLVVIGVMSYVAASEWSKISEYKKHAQELKQANDKLKAEAVTQESKYNAQLGNANERAAKISGQLIVLQGKYQAGLERIAELEKMQLERERLYAEMERTLAKVTVPAGRTDRIKLLNALGY